MCSQRHVPRSTIAMFPAEQLIVLETLQHSLIYSAQSICFRENSPETTCGATEADSGISWGWYRDAVVHTRLLPSLAENHTKPSLPPD